MGGLRMIDANGGVVAYEVRVDIESEGGEVVDVL